MADSPQPTTSTTPAAQSEPATLPQAPAASEPVPGATTPATATAATTTAATTTGATGATGTSGRRPRGTTALVGLVAVAALGVGALALATRPQAPTPTATAAPSSSTATSAPAPTFGPYPRFAADSAFALDVSQAPLDPTGPAQVKLIAKDVADNWGGVAALNLGKYSAGYAVAAPDTPRQDVVFDDCQSKGTTPPGLFDGPKQFAQVPIPADAVPAAGTDGHLAVFDPQQDKLWEFWVAAKRPDGRWQACWGGRIDDVSSSKGQFLPSYGVGAAGLATAGYMVTLKEASDLRIEHALGLVVMQAAPGFRYPANRDDGNSQAPGATKEGTRLRLDPTVDVSTLGLSPLGQAIAKAAQKYGFIVVDKGGAIAVMAESGDRLEQQTGTNPWGRIGQGSDPAQSLKGFPWAKLQVVSDGWEKPSDAYTSAAH